MQFEGVSEYRPLTFDATFAQSESNASLPEIHSPNTIQMHGKVGHIKIL